MAIATTTISLGPNWTQEQQLQQLEDAFTWLGWHDESVSGLAVGVAFISGGTGGSGNETFHDIRPISTTGIGTGTSFYITRTNGLVNFIAVNRPGYGYTGGEVVTISGSDIGTATDLTAQLVVDGTVTSGNVSYAATVNYANYSPAPGFFVSSTTDRNGAVIGVNTTITIREGDTLTIFNGPSSQANFNICYIADTSNVANSSNRTTKVSNNNVSAGSSLTWTPLPGTAGTYFVKTTSNVTTYGTIVVQPADSETISYTSFGSTTGFYDKNFTLTNSGNSRGWGVLKHKIEDNKKYGTTYRLFGFDGSSKNLSYGAYSDWHPGNYYDITNSGSMGAYRRPAGSPYLDLAFRNILSNDITPQITSSDFFTSGYNVVLSSSSDEIYIGSGNESFQLDLNIYRSSIDPNFAVFCYKNPTKSSTILWNNSYGAFFLHNFTTNLWDLDDVFLSGITKITPFNTDTPGLLFDTYLFGSGSGNTSKRSAEYGYTSPHSNSNKSVQTYYYSKIFPQYRGPQHPRIYQRSDSQYNSNFNAVIKGIPLNSRLIPCPYYLPDDFVLIDFDYSVSAANIQQGDTITISGSEVYTVIMGSYNQTTNSRTRGILFCARTV
jgi:hypothetical protein